MSLENAPTHIKLAIDLIALLEDNKIDNQVAIDALTLALNDFKAKQKHANNALSAAAKTAPQP
ncbi:MULTISPECIES: DUF2496 domain-containing protein [Marinomonas]|jgi:hypothetical protein|uniref:DUF2496 domain-containing protein n=1 Tax=Marinomonas TaxID=28253 RepID=UPI00105435FE|nr:DUF2496 domain-containing protein [Marinomonas sp. KMM3893]